MRSGKGEISEGLKPNFWPNTVVSRPRTPAHSIFIRSLFYLYGGRALERGAVEGLAPQGRGSVADDEAGRILGELAKQIQAAVTVQIQRCCAGFEAVFISVLAEREFAWIDLQWS